MRNSCPQPIFRNSIVISRYLYLKKITPVGAVKGKFTSGCIETARAAWVCQTKLGITDLVEIESYRDRLIGIRGLGKRNLVSVSDRVSFQYPGLGSSFCDNQPCLVIVNQFHFDIRYIQVVQIRVFTVNRVADDNRMLSFLSGIISSANPYLMLFRPGSQIGCSNYAWIESYNSGR